MEVDAPGGGLDPWPRHVLIMDGCAAEQSLLVHHFTQRGSTVVHVADERAMLRAVRIQLPEVIVVDRHDAGEVTTRQLFDRLRQDPYTSDCRIVVASRQQFTEATAGHATREAGADAVIDEPYTRSSVQRLINDIHNNNDSGCGFESGPGAAGR